MITSSHAIAPDELLCSSQILRVAGSTEREDGFQHSALGVRP